MESTFSNKQVLFVDFQTKKRIVPLWVERREERSTCMKVCSSIVHSQSGSGSRTGSFTGPLKGLSRMWGNSHVRFLGGSGMATSPGYPTAVGMYMRGNASTFSVTYMKAVLLSKMKHSSKWNRVAKLSKYSQGPSKYEKVLGISGYPSEFVFPSLR